MNDSIDIEGMSAEEYCCYIAEHHPDILHMWEYSDSLIHAPLAKRVRDTVKVAA
jgi:hypothetical protein